MREYRWLAIAHYLGVEQAWQCATGHYLVIVCLAHVLLRLVGCRLTLFGTLASSSPVRSDSELAPDVRVGDWQAIQDVCLQPELMEPLFVAKYQYTAVERPIRLTSVLEVGTIAAPDSWAERSRQASALLVAKASGLHAFAARPDSDH